MDDSDPNDSEGVDVTVTVSVFLLFSSRPAVSPSCLPAVAPPAAGVYSRMWLYLRPHDTRLSLDHWSRFWRSKSFQPNLFNLLAQRLFENVPRLIQFRNDPVYLVSSLPIHVHFFALMTSVTLRYKRSTFFDVTLHLIRQYRQVKGHSHRAKMEAKTKIFFEVRNFLLISYTCSLIFFAFTFAFSRCERALILSDTNGLTEISIYHSVTAAEPCNRAF